MAILLRLFITFLKIGALGFGGGFAVISLIQNEVVDSYGWISGQEFTDIMAVASMTPGPIAINSATYVGYKTGGVLGGLFATLGVITVSFFLIGLIASAMNRFCDNLYLQSVLKVLRPVIIALILAAAINVGYTAFIDYKAIIIFLAAILLLLKTKVHPIVLITGFGIIGSLLYI